MSIFDSLLSAAGSNIDIGQIAERTGLDPATAQQAVAALAQAHTQDGDTVDNAAAQTGLDPDTLSQIIGHIGGEGGVGARASRKPAPRKIAPCAGHEGPDGGATHGVGQWRAFEGVDHGGDSVHAALSSGVFFFGGRGSSALTRA